MRFAPRFLLLACALAWWLLAALPPDVLAQAATSANQDYLVRVWGADEGLSLASVTSVAQTPEGYLWIGTLLSGVVRFDGSRFVSYSSANTPELRSMGVHSLMVDPAGTLWICLYNGSLATWTQRGFTLVGTNLDRQDHLLWSASGQALFLNTDGRLLWGKKLTKDWRWEFITLPAAAPQPQCCADSEGRVWYVTTNRSLGTWRAGEFQPLSPAPGLEGQKVSALSADASGRIWAGTDQALACWRDGRFETMTPTNGEAKLSVKRIVPVGQHGLWVEANKRMRRCEDRVWVAESVGWGRELGYLDSLRFVRGDARGGLWAGQAGMGLMHVAADGTFQRLTTGDGLPSDSLRFAFPDREGNVWTGYARGMLVQVCARTFRTIGAEQGLSDSLVTSVCEDAQGAIWMGTVSGSVARYQDGKCTNYVLPRALRPANSTVVADGRGRIWIGAAQAGLLRFEDGQFRQVLTRQQLGGDARLLFPARDGRLWIGTLTSVFVLDDTGPTCLHTAKSAGDYPSAFAETRDGTIWFGTFAGSLFQWKGERFERLNPPRGSVWSGRTWSLWPTEDGGLWIGTSHGGLLRWQDGKFRRYTTHDGLPSDTIIQVLEDVQRNLWLVTGVGVVRIDEAVLSRYDRGELPALSCGVYDRNDGLLTIGGAIEFQPNCFRARDGTLWFAMVNGVASVRPEDVRFNLVPPTVAIEEVLVNDRHVWPTAPAAVAAAVALPGLAVAPGASPVVRIRPGRRDLDIHYTGLSLTSPSRVRFKYRLRGLEKGWTTAGEERVASYNALPPGDYVFEVTACNSDGLWNDEAATFTLEVTPHYYETKWFVGGLFLATVAGFSAAAFGFARRRARRRIAELKRQGEIERERTRIAQDIHDDLGAGLTRIAMLSQSALDKSPGASEVSRIYSTARAMTRTMDEIVWAINPRHDSLESVAAYFAEFVEEYLSASGLKFQLEIPLELPPCVLDSELRHNLFLALKEALNNVVKHAQASEVIVSLSLRERVFSVVVADNGRGFIAAPPPAKPPGSEGIGRGNGLRNMRRRLEQLGGRCEIDSVSGRGTRVTFEVKLPL